MHRCDRQALRAGHLASSLVLGGRRVAVSRPRVRSVEGRELKLPSWVGVERARSVPGAAASLREGAPGRYSQHHLLHRPLIQRWQSGTMVLNPTLVAAALPAHDAQIDRAEGKLDTAQDVT